MKLVLYWILIIIHHALSKSINITKPYNDSLNHEAKIYIIKLKDGQNSDQMISQQFNGDERNEQINDDSTHKMGTKTVDDPNYKNAVDSQSSVKWNKENKIDPYLTGNDSNDVGMKDVILKYSDTHHINTLKTANADNIDRTARPAIYIKTQNSSKYENNSDINIFPSFTQNHGIRCILRDILHKNMRYIGNYDHEGILNGAKIMDFDDVSSSKSVASANDEPGFLVFNLDKNMSVFKSRNGTEAKVNINNKKLTKEGKNLDDSNIREIKEKLLNSLLNYIDTIITYHSNGTKTTTEEDNFKAKEKSSNDYHPNYFEIHILDEDTDNKELKINQNRQNGEPNVKHVLFDKQNTETNSEQHQSITKNVIKTSYYNIKEPQSNLPGSMKNITVTNMHNQKVLNGKKLPEQSFETYERLEKIYKSDPNVVDNKHPNYFEDVQKADARDYNGDISLETSYEDKSVIEKQIHNKENIEPQNTSLLFFFGKIKNRTVPNFESDTDSIYSLNSSLDIINVIKNIFLPIKNYTKATLTSTSNRDKNNNLKTIKDYTNFTVINKSTEEVKNHEARENPFLVTKAFPRNKNYISKIKSEEVENSPNVNIMHTSNNKAVGKMADSNYSEYMKFNHGLVEEEQVGIKALYGTKTYINEEGKLNKPKNNSILANSIVRDRLYVPQQSEWVKEVNKEFKMNENELKLKHNKYFKDDGYTRLHINIEID